MNSENGSVTEPVMEYFETSIPSPHHLDISSGFTSKSTPDSALISPETHTPTSPVCRSTNTNTPAGNVSDQLLDTLENISLLSRLQNFNAYRSDNLDVKKKSSKNKRVCFVPHCDSGHSSTLKKNKMNNVKNPALFRVPQDKTRFAEWKRAIRGRKDRRMNRNDYVCEYHFEERFLERYYRFALPNGTYHFEPRSRVYLKYNAVPTKCKIIRPLEMPRTWLRPTVNRNASQRGLTKPNLPEKKKHQTNSPSINIFPSSSEIKNQKSRKKPEKIKQLPIIVDCGENFDDFIGVEFMSEAPEFSFEIVSEEPVRRPYWSKVLIPETNHLCYQYWKSTLPSGLPVRMVRVSSDLSVEMVFGSVSSRWINHEKLVDYSMLEEIFELIENTKPCSSAISNVPYNRCRGYLSETENSNFCYQCARRNEKSLDKETKISSLTRKIERLEARQRLMTKQLLSCGENINRYPKVERINEWQPADEVFREKLKKELLEEWNTSQEDGGEEEEIIINEQMQKISLIEPTSYSESLIIDEFTEASDDNTEEYILSSVME